jgi:hypothetical protein
MELLHIEACHSFLNRSSASAWPPAQVLERRSNSWADMPPKKGEPATKRKTIGTAAAKASAGAAAAKTSAGAAAAKTSAGAAALKTSAGAAVAKTSAGAAGAKTSAGAAGAKTSAGAAGAKISAGAAAAKANTGSAAANTSSSAVSPALIVAQKAIVRAADPTVKHDASAAPPTQMPKADPAIPSEMADASTAPPTTPSAQAASAGSHSPAPKVSTFTASSVKANAAPPVEKPRKAASAPPPPYYEDVWGEVYLAGTEWDQLQSVHNVSWDFSHLDDALTDGIFSAENAPMVHLFGCTEPQLVPTSANDETGTITIVPVIVAIVSAFPPPAQVGIKSVQKTDEEITDMKDIRMGWHARPADNAPRRNPPKTTVYVLKCTERRARLKNMNEEAVHKYDYVLPYVIRPGVGDDETPETSVQVLADDLEGRANPLMMEFDYELDDLDEFVAEQIKENDDINEDTHAAPIREAIQAAVKDSKQKFKASRDAIKARADALSKEEKESIANMKVYKFYPSNEEEKYPDVSGIKSTYVNRYYGRADGVF